MSGSINLNNNTIAEGIVTGHATTPVFKATAGGVTLQRGFSPTITRNAAGDYTLQLSPVRAYNDCHFEVCCRTEGGGTGPVNAQVIDATGGAFRVLMKDSAATPTAVDADFNITVRLAEGAGA
jgi:hypothetical protein